VPSDDELLRQEINARLEARDVAGFLRQLERAYSSPVNPADQLPEPLRNSLGNYLRKAERLLGKDHPLMEVVNDLLSRCLAAAPIEVELVRVYAGVIAQALEDGFGVQSGGGHGGGYYLSVTDFPRPGDRRLSDFPVDT
jgi:hypothetical protein